MAERTVIFAIASLFIAGMLAEFILTNLGSQWEHYVLAAVFVAFTIIAATHVANS